MRKSWSPQLKSVILLNPVLWIIAGIILFIFVFFGYSVTHNLEIFILFVLYLAAFYMIWSVCRSWDMGGYNSITIDTDNRMFIFDNKVKVPFSAVEDISFEKVPAPDLPWFFLIIPQVGASINLLIYNSVVQIKLKGCEMITFSVQNKSDAQDIVKHLQLCGFDVYMTELEEDELKGNLTSLLYLLAGLFCLWWIISNIFF